MATLVSKDPVEALVQYVQDIKPYHSKIIDILVEYIYTDPISITITDTIAFNIGVDLNRYTTYCSTGFDTSSFDTIIIDNPPLNVNNGEDIGNFDQNTGCDDLLDGYMKVTFNEVLSFTQGSNIQLWDTVGTTIDDATDNVGVDGNGYDIGGYDTQRIRKNVDVDGASLTVTLDPVTNIFTSSAPHTWIADEPIYFWAIGGSLPTYDHNGESVTVFPYTPFYLIYVSPTEFKISLEPAGTEMDILTGTSSTLFVGEGLYEPFLQVDQTLSAAIDVNTIDSIDMSNELVKLTNSVGSNNTKAQASITDAIEFHVGHLELVDYIGVGMTEGAAANITSGAAFVGSWDMPYWDIGGFDEELGVTVQLISP